MEDLSSLVNSIVNNYIVRPTGGLLSQGVNGFLFDILADEEAMFDSDITDHYVEQNYAIQDHIALRPPKFTLTGFVAELKDVLPIRFTSLSSAVASINLIGEYAQNFALQATQVYKEIVNFDTPSGSPTSQYPSIYQLFSEVSTSATYQQNAYNYFVNLWMNRVLCTVETPWSVWNNMAIESVRILQRDQNKYVTEFSVTFKQIRTVQTQSIPAPGNFALQGVQEIEQKYSGNADPYNEPVSFTSGSIAGQTTLPDGTSIDTSLLQNAQAQGLL